MGGYRLQFAVTPPQFKGVIHLQAQGEATRFLQEEILLLLEKGAIKIVPPKHSQFSFYSWYFLVPKKGGRGLQAILDLRALNKHIRKYNFRMLTHTTLLYFLHPGNWFTSTDLKDDFFHIPIYPPHRKYLRFSFQGINYEYLVLPFCLSLIPGSAQALVNDVLRDCLNRFVFVYLNDILIFSKSVPEHRNHVCLVLQRLLENQLFIKAEKCEFHRTTMSFLSFVIAPARSKWKPPRLRQCLIGPNQGLGRRCRGSWGCPTFTTGLFASTARWLPP
ncbi:hypothetical protein LDENG_00223770 [Lucifuga dentata]|nr:hypothetical protein LDENG_00223770 [Lucifuga dentata]